MSESQEERKRSLRLSNKRGGGENFFLQILA